MTMRVIADCSAEGINGVFLSDGKVSGDNIGIGFNKQEIKKIMVTDDASEQDGLMFAFASSDGENFKVIIGIERDGEFIGADRIIQKFTEAAEVIQHADS